MSASTFIVEAQDRLGPVDVAALGARSGLLWRSGDFVLAGIGPSARVAVDRPTGASAAHEALSALAGPNDIKGQPGSGPVGFGAFPFAPNESSWLDVPSIVLAESGDSRWLTVLDPITKLDAERLVTAIVAAERLTRRPSTIEITFTRQADDWRDNVVLAARKRVRAGLLKKAVMSRELLLTPDSQFDVASIVGELVRSFAGAYVFSVDGFVGASPELLVARSGRQVKAHPLAGTAPRGVNRQDDEHRIELLLESTKDRIEHQITIDWLLTELLRFSSYVDAEPEPSIVTMPNVHHLGTRVEGMLFEPPASVLDLVAAVHPTPALGGDPRDDALGLIKELEGFDRGRYGGPVGWVDAEGNGEFAVGIRSAQLDRTTARVVAGVGVVADSDPQAELEETQAKFRAMLGVLLGRNPSSVAIGPKCARPRTGAPTPSSSRFII